MTANAIAPAVGKHGRDKQKIGVSGVADHADSIAFLATVLRAIEGSAVGTMTLSGTCGDIVDKRAEQRSASLIVPVYNSAPTLTVLCTRIVAAMDAANQPFHVFFVDDASTDGSADTLRGLALRDRRVRAVLHARNGGQAAAVRTGIAHACDSIVVTLDDDLSHRPEDIPRLLQCLFEAADEHALVIAVYTGRRSVLWRGLASIAANVLCNIFLKRPLPLRATAFCAFHRTLGETLIRAGARRDAAWLVLLVQAAARTVTVPVVIEASGLPRSRYRMASLWSLFRCRARSFVLRRLLVFAGFTAMFAVLVTTRAVRHDVTSVVFLALVGFTVMLAATTIALTWMAIADRIGTDEDDPSATCFPAHE
jgi:glycosyltransferase involved in cell wall biosynthesis